jgi:hypothetical protein
VSSTTRKQDEPGYYAAHQRQYRQGMAAKLNEIDEKVTQVLRVLSARNNEDCKNDKHQSPT